MDAVFKKLQFKSQKKVLIMAAPDSFKVPMEAMAAHTQICEHPKEGEKFDFALIFGETRADMESRARAVLPLLEADAVFWIAYPKKSSKNYRADYDRDSGWELLGEWGMEPVRQVAIDGDWSALRFRKVENIPKLTRKFGMLTEKQKP
ncbi:hypothetical protein [Cyclobacterium xiamenense]|jgi:hypothetical protein|uniref:hypothetical protein n=1 Tax=Cyclobacterium xiamenense TaxID=1297121 RepID=UPI0035D02973